MKYVLTTLAGMLVGGAAALAALYYNPLNTSQPLASSSTGWTLEYDFPAGSAIVLTHGGQLELPSIPTEIAALWETAIKRTVLNVLVLEDPSGTPQAIATRLSVPSTDTDLLLRGVIVEDHWLVTVPGQGTLFVGGHNNVWPLLKDTFIPVTYLQREWRGPASYAVTSGPGPRRSADVVGVNGTFEKLHGFARETYSLEKFSASRGIEAMRGSLEIALDEDANADAAAPITAGLAAE
jgi:hypothetical protein